jgi:hypothetical protein
MYLRWKGKRLKDLKIGSWNVLALYRRSKLIWGDSVDHDIRILGEKLEEFGIK